MLKQTTLKLAGALFGASILGIVISIIIIFTFGGIGSHSVSQNSSSQGTSASSSVSSSANSSAASQSSSEVSSSLSTTSSTSSTPAIQYSTGGVIGNPVGKVFLGGLSILIVFSILYNTAWKEGDKDPNRIRYGHMKKFMAKGLVAGLLSIIPYIIYTTVFLIMNAAIPNTMAQLTVGVIYRVLNMQFIIIGDGWLNYPIVCYALLLIYPLASTIGYITGYKGIIIWTKIIYKDNGKTSKRRQKYLDRLKK